MKFYKKLLYGILLLSSLLVSGQSNIDHLQTEYITTPIGLDVKQPHFSWQMIPKVGVYGQQQSAYRVLVMDEHGKFVWDSGKVPDSRSVGIAYEGENLEPRTKYDFTVTVWDEKGESSANSSWFETGMLNGGLNAWQGAQWIGGGDEDMVFYSHYLSVFRFEYDVQLEKKSTKASFLMGGNDRRLMNKNLNIQGVASQKDQNYLEFELDVSSVDGTEEGKARMNVYRVGYAPDDSKNQPFRSFDIPLTLINNENKYDKHTIYSECVFGFFQLWVDGNEEKNLVSTNDDTLPPPRGKIGFNVNPVGRGNDYISYPMVADIGFHLKKNQHATFSNIRIKNYRKPSNSLFETGITQSEIEGGIFKKILQENKTVSATDKGYFIKTKNEPVLMLADPSQNAAPMLRTEFSSENKIISKARLYVTSRGIYEVYLNGKRVSNDYFTPGLTQYNKTHMYQTYDVTPHIKKGEANALGAWLGEGWWSGNITYVGENWNFFGDRSSLLAQLVISYADGTQQTISSNDQDWKLFTEGPIKIGSFFQGEVYDARLEDKIVDWTQSNYDDSNWKKALEVPLENNVFTGDDLSFDQMQLYGQIGPNPSLVKTLTAKSVKEIRPGVFVYDMGQNMVGVPEIELPQGVKGDTITLRYSEVTYPDLKEYEPNVGMVMLENIRAALTQDLYIRKGGMETIQPRFTFHGFRFLEITGIDAPLPLNSVKGLVISSIDELASEYKTSNELVNKLWENITWSLRGNFLSIPTDTPARNERMGWSGDINVFSKTSTFLAHAEPFLRRHLMAMRDIQREDGRFTDVAPVGGGFGGTLWGSAGMVIPWELYQQYGDLQVLKEHYGAMKDYIQFLDGKIDPETGVLNEGPLGDWLSPEGYKNDDTLLWAAYHLYGLEIISKSARLLGKTEEAQQFEKQYEERKQFLNNTYFDEQNGKTLHLGNQSLRFGPPLPENMLKKKGDYVDTQASYAIPLHLEVLTEANKEKAVDNLIASIQRENMDELGVNRPEYSLMTGFIGTASLNHALSNHGEHETAYRLLQQTSYPSWLYSVKNGATTIWERLNSYTVENGFSGNNSMNSFNHYSFGAVAAWMYNYSLGIQRNPEHPGFKKFVLQPVPDPTAEMTWAKGYYDSVYGKIKSEWRLLDEGWEYNATVPPNTKATLLLPVDSVKKVMVNGKKVGKSPNIQVLTSEVNEVRLSLTSGVYQIQIKQ